MKIDYRPSKCEKAQNQFIRGMITRVQQNPDLKTYSINIKHECSNVEDTNVLFPDNPNVAKCGSVIVSRPDALCNEIKIGGQDWNSVL